MPSDLGRPMPVSRRTLALGAAWSIPAVIVTAPAAHAASSISCTGCWTLNWDSSPSPYNNDFTTHTGTTNWTRDGYLTPPTGVSGCGWLTAKVTQSRKSGQYMGTSTTTRSDTRGDFSIGNYSDYYHIDTDTGAGINGVMGLVLNQSSLSGVVAEEQITFEFYRAITSVSFTIYDFTRSTSTTASGYADAVSFDRSTTVTDSTPSGNGGGTGSARLISSVNATAALSQTTSSLTNWVYRSGDFKTISNAGLTETADSNRNVGVTITMGGASNFTMGYKNLGQVTNSANANDQWIAIGDLTVCT